jgi:hypothetical protein
MFYPVFQNTLRPGRKFRKEAPKGQPEGDAVKGNTRKAMG